MERYYRVLLLISLIGIATGIAGLILEQRVIAVAGCLVVPLIAYASAVVISLFKRN